MLGGRIKYSNSSESIYREAENACRAESLFSQKNELCAPYLQDSEIGTSIGLHSYIQLSIYTIYIIHVYVTHSREINLENKRDNIILGLSVCLSLAGL